MIQVRIELPGEQVAASYYAAERERAVLVLTASEVRRRGFGGKLTEPLEGSISHLAKAHGAAHSGFGAPLPQLLRFVR